VSMTIAALIGSAVSLPMSIVSFVTSQRVAYRDTLSTPKLQWLTPMTYSLRDQVGRRRPTIAIALAIYNSGAQPGIIEDVAVRVIRHKPCWTEAAFQAEMLGTDLRYITLPEIERHSAPMTQLLVEGHNTASFVVAFGQRSKGPWTWTPGDYTVAVFEAKLDKEWCMRTSFSFVLPEKEASDCLTASSVHVATYQRWSKEVSIRRDKFCGRFHNGPEPNKLG